MAKELSLEEIYKRVKADYDLENLLAPYRDSGTLEQPIERTTGTMLDWLINKKKFPPDIAGAALVSTLFEIRAGRNFPGDGSYGSQGRDLVRAVAQRCDDFNKKKLSTDMFKTIAGAKIEVMDEVIFEQVRRQFPALLVPVSPGTWRWLRRRRQRKNEPA